MRNFSTFFGAFAKIYTLSDENGIVFYVGCTVRELGERLKSHLSEANSNRPYANKIKNEKIRSLDFQVVITEVDRMWVTGIKPQWAISKATDLEHEWIWHFRGLGYKLANRIPRPKDQSEILEEVVTQI